MRYTHGCKPRNPYNMIIQENHAAGRANSIISYKVLTSYFSSRFASRHIINS